MSDIQIGELYLVKGFCLLIPTKERASRRLSGGCGRPAAYRHAKELSQIFKCNVSVVEPNTYVVLLEMDEVYFKVLDSNGNIGWIYCSDFSGYFKLVKANQ
jgi:hypothetical protein